MLRQVTFTNFIAVPLAFMCLGPDREPNYLYHDKYITLTDYTNTSEKARFILTSSISNKKIFDLSMILKQVEQCKFMIAKKV